jgi:hypothetical protein
VCGLPSDLSKVLVDSKPKWQQLRPPPLHRIFTKAVVSGSEMIETSKLDSATRLAHETVC